MMHSSFQLIDGTVDTSEKNKSRLNEARRQFYIGMNCYDAVEEQKEQEWSQRLSEGAAWLAANGVIATLDAQHECYLHPENDAA